MGIVVRELFAEFGAKYQMRLLAGEKGLNRVMDWVHILEDVEAAKFLNGNELIFTTGIGKNMEHWLMCLIQGIYQRNACGMIVNIGPYMETITGSNGVIIPPEGYLPGVRKICDEFGIMMICDEVMAGWGRSGKMFSFENFDVKPDIVTFAKGVTCGYVPLGGVVVSKEIAEYFDDHKLMCGLTYSGHPLACAAGVACVEYYKSHNILENVAKSGKVLGEELEECRETFRCVGDVRYIGLWSSIELVKDKETKEPLVPYGKDPENIMGAVIGKLAKRHFLTYSHENRIFIAPPLIITEQQVKEEMAKVKEVLAEVDKEFL